MSDNGGATVETKVCEGLGCLNIIPSSRAVSILRDREAGHKSTDGEVEVVGGSCGRLKPFLCIKCQEKADSCNSRSSKNWFGSQFVLGGAGVQHSAAHSVS